MTGNAVTASKSTAMYPVHRLNGVVLLLLLLATLLLGLGSSIHSRMMWLGEELWDNYYLLDPDAKAPTCSTDVDIDAAVKKQLAQSQDDDFSLFDSAPDPKAIRSSIEKNLAMCKEQHANYDKMQSQITPWLVGYKSVERAVSKWLLDNMALKTYLFMAIFAIAAAVAAFDNEQISLRLARNRGEWRLVEGAQLVINGLMAYSLYSYGQRLENSPDAGAILDLQIGWGIVFSLLILINVWRFLRVPARMPPGNIGPTSGLAIPLYCWMGLIAFGYFQGASHYSEGLAVNFSQMSNLSSMFINIGLYVLVGMALKQTRLPDLLLNVIKPWNLPPGPLAALVIFTTAFPTAFTGASGIFVLAAGGVVYDELRKAGARRQLALATTAMSGSLGVVLNPCLLIVIVAALNREVTTDQLYGWGFWVFLMSACLFSFVVWRDEKRWLPENLDAGKALRESISALRYLVPHVVLFAVVIFLFWFLLDLSFTENTAPLILPVIMLALVFLDTKERDNGYGRWRTFWNRSTAAASDSAVHTGALLALIGFSISMGGVLERSHLVTLLFPESLTNPWLVMLSVVVILTFIGMIMDPFGAVILVSATISQVAIHQGINPVHFWVVTLVAFELGYLTPPVALNHLLTRQVVGETEVIAADATGTFWQRYERLLLPLVVMGTTLLIVAFVPLFFYL